MSLVLVEIPLSAATPNCSMTLADADYRFSVRWNKLANCWMLNIENGDGTRILSSIPLICGAELLEQYAHLLLGFGLVAMTDGDETAVPTYANLGSTGHLYAVVDG